MTIYNVPAGTIYRTKNGNEAGKAPMGASVELGGTTISKGGTEYSIISWANSSKMVGMFIDKKLLKVVGEPEPEPEPPEEPGEYVPPSQMKTLEADGNWWLWELVGKVE